MIRPKLRDPGDAGQGVGLNDPDPLVIYAETLMPDGAKVLDLGSGRGDHGFYLTLGERGHQVHSVDIDPKAVNEGQKLARKIGGRALQNTFYEGDMRYLSTSETDYDAVLAVQSLQHILPKTDAYDLLDRSTKIVKAGGLHVVKAYIASPEQQKKKGGEYALFEDGELAEIYKQAGWEIEDYVSTGIRPLRNVHKGKRSWSYVVSYTELIARETEKAKYRDRLLKASDATRDEDLARQLKAQADQL